MLCTIHAYGFPCSALLARCSRLSDTLLGLNEARGLSLSSVTCPVQELMSSMTSTRAVSIVRH